MVSDAEVVAGEAVSCARELPVQPTPENPNPALHMMIRGGDDCVLPGLDFEAVMDFVGVAGSAYTHGIAVANFDWIGSMPAMVFAAFIFVPQAARALGALQPPADEVAPALLACLDDRDANQSSCRWHASGPSAG